MIGKRRCRPRYVVVHSWEDLFETFAAENERITGRQFVYTEDKQGDPGERKGNEVTPFVEWVTVFKDSNDSVNVTVPGSVANAETRGNDPLQSKKLSVLKGNRRDSVVRRCAKECVRRFRAPSRQNVLFLRLEPKGASSGYPLD